MRIIIKDELLMLLGMVICLVALLYPHSLTILLFFGLGNFLIIIGLVLYLKIVWKDLKKHKVF